MNRVLVISMALMLFACSSTFTSGQKEVLHSQLDPKDVPAQKDVIGKQQRVLVLTVLAKDDGYSIEKSVIATGTVSQTIDLNREVLITARGANGEVIAQVSVFNPREIHTAGARKPAKAVLDKGYFTVSLPKPETIKMIDIEVRRGPNASLKQSFRSADKEGARSDGSPMLFVPR